MPECRLIGAVVAKGNWAVQSHGFSRYLPIGRTTVVVDYLNRWGIDEIALIDIDATRERRLPLFDDITRCASKCLVPLAVGGGINSLGTMERLLRSGADKVIVNSAALSNPAVITEGARNFGDQCIIVSIDAVKVGPGVYRVVRGGVTPTDTEVVEHARRVAEIGAGEILLNSVDRDGTRQGYDLGLLNAVAAAVKIPVIACGGVGTARHFLEGYEAGLTSLAAANYFNHCEHSVVLAKRFLQEHGADVRVDTPFTYADLDVNDRGRLAGPNEQLLEHLRFQYIEEEVI